jgi:hypothetical protein
MWWRKFDKKEECFIFCQVSDNKENAKKGTWDHFFLIFFINTVKKYKIECPSSDKRNVKMKYPK